ncbi:molybdopterin-guanine dinucleotide biosynthesis protein B [Paenibacillus alkalitolerans]|uniref:molybdopterin-guanine dinucleotide biosynthesis protein B n=1 Tax=Paenibacillus alkalitolerans TaxID=2799335 RepID=UPI0018F748EA|nr:molybdopterin-guanine dinucleotide biosynthesis protein B [Paenibacillus alkalitolerans]
MGYKKTGKTTLVCRLAERFTSEGLRVATIKHDAHGFEPDVPGTDSWKHRQAGALWSAVVSPERTAFFEEKSADLDELLLRMQEADVVLIEGFKGKPYPKLALIQSVEQKEILDGLESVFGIVTWADRNDEWVSGLGSGRGLPVYSFDDLESIVRAIKTNTMREAVTENISEETL